MSQNSDILVIGGGIAGISAAARLAETASVTVLEGEPHLGYHSTGRSAAIFVLNYGNATLRALNAASVAELSGDLLGESVLSPRGELLVAEEADVAELDRQVAESTGVERISVDEAVKMVPVLRRDRVAAAMIEPEAQDIDVDRLLQGFAQLLRARGGRIVTGAPVAGVSRAGDGWQVTAGGETYHTDTVINAAGAWADHVAALAGVAQVGLQPMRRSAVIMPVPDGMAYRDWPLVGSVREDWYARPEATGLMISPADEDPVEAQDAWPDDMVLAEGLDRFSQFMDVPLRRPVHQWAGLRSFVADRSPVCGYAPDAPGFFWLAGQGGYGVQTSPALSALTAELILGRTPTLPAPVVEALGPHRFQSHAS